MQNEFHWGTMRLVTTPGLPSLSALYKSRVPPSKASQSCRHRF